MSKTLVPGCSIEYKGEKYCVGLIGSFTFSASKYPYMDEIIVLEIESNEWNF